MQKYMLHLIYMNQTIIWKSKITHIAKCLVPTTPWPLESYTTKSALLQTSMTGDPVQRGRQKLCSIMCLHHLIVGPACEGRHHC
jgi:hypothetical protein